MTVIESAFEMLGDLNQLQFFVYLWLFISIFATFVNGLTRRKAWILTVYFTATFIVLAVVSHWRLKNILHRDPIPTEPTALIFLTFLFTGAGVWTAFYMSSLSKKPKGWFYMRCSQWMIRSADYVESVLIRKLREIAEWVASKENTTNSLAQLTSRLEQENRSN